MRCSLVPLLPSYFWIKRLEFVNPIGIVVEKVRATNCSFPVHSNLFSFPCFIFPGALFDSFICFNLQYKKMGRQKKKVQDSDKHKRNVNPFSTRD